MSWPPRCSSSSPLCGPSSGWRLPPQGVALKKGFVVPDTGMRESISTVVLDLDDTLIATARARKRAYRILGEHGIDPREAESVQRRWWQAYYRGECSMADLRQGRWIDLG